MNHSPHPEPNDGAIVAAVLEGDRDRFDILVRRYQGALIKAAASRLGHLQLAEDAVQETFYSALRWLESYDSRYSFRTWLWTILLNQCRRLGARRAKDEQRQSGGQSCIAAADQQAAPPEVLLGKERDRLVRELLSRLPEAEADALRLRFFGGLKFQEIADAMQSGLSTAKVRVRRGLTTLSKWIADPAATPSKESRS